MPDSLSFMKRPAQRETNRESHPSFFITLSRDSPSSSIRINFARLALAACTVRLRVNDSN